MTNKQWIRFAQRGSVSLLLIWVSSSLMAQPHYYDYIHQKPQPLTKMDEEEAHYRDAIDSGMVEVITNDMNHLIFNRMQPFYRRQSFDPGIYVGLGLGSEAGDIRFSTKNYSVSFGTEGGLARVFAGYKWFYKKSGWFVSGELAGDYTSAKNEDSFRSQDDEKWRQKNRRLYAGDVSLLLGHRLPSQDDAWLRLGGTFTRLNHDAYLSGADFVVADFDKWMAGYTVELGMEAYLGEHMFLRFAQGYRYYPQHTFKLIDYEQSGETGSMGFAPSDYQARLGLGYHFSENKAYKYFASTVPMRGPYLGAHFGSDRVVSQSTHVDDTFEKYVFTSSNASMLAGIYGGYFFPMSEFFSGFMGQFGLGLEGMGQMSSQGQDYQFLNTLRTIEAWHVAAMLSYQLVNNNHLYLKAGWGYMTLRSPFAPSDSGEKINPKEFQGVAWNKNLPTWVGAFGYESMVSRHVAVRSEIDVSLPKKTEFTNGRLHDEYKSHVYAYKLGVSYRFSKD